MLIICNRKHTFHIFILFKDYKLTLNPSSSVLRSVYSQLQKILIILISRIYDWLSIWFHYSITLKIYQTKTGLYNSYKIKLMHKVNKNILSPLVLSKKSWHFCIAFQTGRHNWIFMFYGFFFTETLQHVVHIILNNIPIFLSNSSESLFFLSFHYLAFYWDIYMYTL